MFWLMLLGIYMGWVEATSPSKVIAAPTPYDWYAPLPEPPEYLRNTGTGEKADTYVRARSRR